ncbi:MAG: hypothetical protein R3291_00395, partial [Thermoplasmata archaeon]|nr:hypothetical protein [Thermoplasmata archaeon]
MSRPAQVSLLTAVLLLAGFILMPDSGRAAAEGQFLPPHTDEGLDTDGDGLFDQLVLTARVSVVTAGTFVVSATLHDATFVLSVPASNTTSLGGGLHNVTLLFYGPAIAQAGVDGPYEVDLQLVDADTFSFLDGDTHSTVGYLTTAFEAPPSFTPPHLDAGLDTDANGDFDFLVVDASVNITSPGTFLFRGLLRRANTSLLLSTSNETALEEGPHSVQLRFPGPFINVSGVDGPYTADLRIFETESGLQFDSDSHATAAYAHTAFDGPPATFAPPHADTGLDTDGNGLFDFLVVNASLQVDDPGSFEVQGALRDANLSLLTMASNTTNLTAGSQTVPVRFPGAAINLSGEDGPYTVEMSLRDLATGATWDADVHNTSAYAYGSFDGPPGVFSPPHTEFGLDADNNGRFEYLVVNASLQVFKNGTFRIFASLQFTPSPVGFLVENVTFLTPGFHQVPLWFYGPVLGETGNQAVEVNLILHDEATATTLDTDIHPTGPHVASDFEVAESWNAAAAPLDPVIDGALDPGEWTEATTVNLSAVPGNQVPGWLHIMNNETALLLAYDAVGDTTEDEDDGASFSFDTDNDGLTTNGREDQFVQRGTPENQAHYVFLFPFWVPEDAPYDTDLARHEG